MKKKLLFISLAENIMQDILSGKLKAGSKVASVRDMAVEYKVNPKTVQKAFSYLEEHDLFESRTGEGRYVTADKDKLLTIKRLLLDETIDQFIATVSNYDLTNEQILSIVQKKLGSDNK